MGNLKRSKRPLPKTIVSCAALPAISEAAPASPDQLSLGSSQESYLSENDMSRKILQNKPGKPVFKQLATAAAAAAAAVAPRTGGVRLLDTVK